MLTGGASKVWLPTEEVAVNVKLQALGRRNPLGADWSSGLLSHSNMVEGQPHNTQSFTNFAISSFYDSTKILSPIANFLSEELSICEPSKSRLYPLRGHLP